MPSRYYKSLSVENGYNHREHRSKKGRKRTRFYYDFTRKNKIDKIQEDEAEVEMNRLKYNNIYMDPETNNEATNEEAKDENKEEASKEEDADKDSE